MPINVRQYDVQPALGRHMVLDPRSLAHRTPYTGQHLRAREWAPKIPVLNQQDLIGQGIRTSRLFPGIDDMDALGACTGNAATAALSVLLSATQCKQAGLDTTHQAEAETFAIRLYADATTRDEWHEDTWPSEDCGSSGLGVAKALKARGLIDSYKPATTAEELCLLLQDGPVLMGMPWLAAFDSPPSSTALLDDIPNWRDSPVAGGHEVCITALESVAVDETAGRLIPAHTILRAQNSWSTTYGDQGSFRLSLAVYQALRSEIDLIQPRLDASR